MAVENRVLLPVTCITAMSAPPQHTSRHNTHTTFPTHFTPQHTHYSGSQPADVLWYMDTNTHTTHTHTIQDLSQLTCYGTWKHTHTTHTHYTLSQTADVLSYTHTHRRFERSASSRAMVYIDTHTHTQHTHYSAHMLCSIWKHTHTHTHTHTT